MDHLPQGFRLLAEFQTLKREVFQIDGSKTNTERPILKSESTNEL